MRARRDLPVWLLGWTNLPLGVTGAVGLSGDGRFVSVGGRIVGGPTLPTARLLWAPRGETAAYQTRTGAVVKFADVRELATFLAGSEETQEAFIEQLFHYVVKQPIRAYGPWKLSEFRQAFADNHYNVRKLVVEIVTASALPPDNGKTGDE